MTDEETPPTPAFLAEVDITTINEKLAGLIMSIRILDTRIASSAMTGDQVVAEVAEMIQPTDLFALEIRSLSIVYSLLRKWLKDKGANLPRHRTSRAIMELSNLYADSEEKQAAEEMASQIYHAGKRVTSQEVDSPALLKEVAS